MFDFGVLPPEINSARMYAGPGSGPMTAAVSAWDALAAQLESYAAGYCAALLELHGQAWSGGASTEMAVAVAPYVTWAITTAAEAGQAAAQARAAAAAYEAAFAATVPPHVVTANRIQLSALIATNFFGQNTPAIAATEAAYAEMWAQDATAMYAYAASSSAAATLTPFRQPPRTTNAHGHSAQAAAVDRAASTSAGQARATLAWGIPSNSSPTDAFGSSASDSGWSSLLTSVNGFNTLVTVPGQTFSGAVRTVFSAGLFGTGLNLANIQAAKAAAAAAHVPTAAAIRASMLGSMDRATLVGKLSVPKAWTAANPAAVVVDEPVPLSANMFRAATSSAPASATGLGGMPAVREADRAGGVPVLRNGRRAFRMPRPAYGG